MIEPTVMRFVIASPDVIPSDSDVIPNAGEGTAPPAVWVYRYTHPTKGWRLSIATHAEPGSQALSLGGFRIAPEERTSSPGFDSDREAIGLAIGMEEKVGWSRLMHIGGPLALATSRRIVGGKCVLHPTADARVGQPNDRELLDFAVDCFRDVESREGFFLTTGQDLGHGRVSNSEQGSLAYLNERFKGSVVADTSKPTAEGNYFVLHGMLRGAGVQIEKATVGLIGCGNIGMHILGKLREAGATVLALESSEARRADIAALDIRTFTPDEKQVFLTLPMDAVVVNAAGGSLDDATIDLIARNSRLRVVCGSENLVMPDHAAGSQALHEAHKLYAPTELGGMMGYLTAVEEYLAHLEDVPFDVNTMLVAAQKLEPVCYAAAKLACDSGFAFSFEEAVKQVASEAAK